MSLRDDVTQPMSLADELRKLAEKWRRTYEEGQPIGSKGAFTYDIEKRCADELSALLAQHAVAEPSKGLLSEPVQAFIRSNKGVSLDLSSYQDGDDELPAAHAAEQPKLTSVWTITEEAAKHSHFCYHKDSDEWKCFCGEVLSKYVMPYDERRKLNSLDREMVFVRFNHKDHFRLVLHGLLTSPVAPPPQQKENDDATKMR
jgi:hypothetical protein